MPAGVPPVAMRTVAFSKSLLPLQRPVSAGSARSQFRTVAMTQYEQVPGRASPHTLVVSYPGLEEEKLGAGLEVLAKLLDK